MGLGIATAACASPDVAAASGQAETAGDGTVLVFEGGLRGCWLADGNLRQTIAFSFGSDPVPAGFVTDGPDRYVHTSTLAGSGDLSADAGTFTTRTSSTDAFTLLLQDSNT